MLHVLLFFTTSHHGIELPFPCDIADGSTALHAVCCQWRHSVCLLLYVYACISSISYLCLSMYIITMPPSFFLCWTLHYTACSLHTAHLPPPAHRAPCGCYFSVVRQADSGGGVNRSTPLQLVFGSSCLLVPSLHAHTLPLVVTLVQFDGVPVSDSCFAIPHSQPSSHISCIYSFTCLFTHLPWWRQLQVSPIFSPLISSHTSIIHHTI